MAHLWQQPYVNVFKHFQIQTWKKSSKEGEVETFMDKTLKATVYRISGSIPAANYIQLPHTSTQSLGLTGRYFYLLFKPTPAKYFVVHLDVATQDGMVVRMSFSNLFKEFKLTSTWLQFPFVCHASSSSVSGAAGLTSRDQLGPAPVTTHWTVLCLDLQQILSAYLNRRYSYLKSIRLCANLSVRNVFTSDALYQPGVTYDQAKKSGRQFVQLASGLAPMPREMAFPIAASYNWHDVYDHIRFPTEAAVGQHKPFDSVQMLSSHSADSAAGQRMDGKTVYVNRASSSGVTAIDSATNRPSNGGKRNVVVRELPPVGVDENGDVQVVTDGVGDIHIFANADNKVHVHQQRSETAKLINSNVAPSTVLPSRNESYRSLKPDPILQLRRVVGFGGATLRDIVWNVTGSLIIYPCHAVIVAMQANNGQQKFFVGHTDKISCLCLNGNSTLLASGQGGPQSVVRIWHIRTTECLAMFKTHSHSLSCLSMSHGGGTLCGVGRDSLGKNLVVIWNTSQVSKGGQVSVIAKAHTEVDIARMKIAAFDDTRMISCGRDNIRLWRIKDAALRSAPVNLGEYHSLEFTDCCFEAGYEPAKDPLDRVVYACSKSGHIFEVDYSKVVVRHVRRLNAVSDVVRTTNNTKQKQTVSVNSAISILAMCVNESFCVTGSDDGYLRLWPLDFKNVLLEAQHDGPVTGVDISNDCIRVLAATSTGNLGILDISTRNYTTVMRSHTGRILSVAIDKQHRHIATASDDHTIRIWDLDTLQQLYDFTAPQECPCVIAYHPGQQVFACGFESGLLRVFNIATTSMVAELKQHRGKVTGVVFNPVSAHLYSCSSVGSLALHDVHDDKYQLMRLLGNSVARGDNRGGQGLTCSEDGRHLAFVGPTDLTISVVDAKSLDEVMRIDITSLNTVDNSRTVIDSAVGVQFSPQNVRHILVTTTANKLLKFDAKNGRIIAEIDNVHRSGCTSLCVSRDGRHLVTAGDKVVKVWDYTMKLDLNFQVFIGHSDTISYVSFTPDMSSLLSVGEAIFVWDFSGSEDPAEQSHNQIAEGRTKVKNYYTGGEEDLSFYVGDSTGDHLKMKSRGQRAEDAPRKHAPQPTRHEPSVFAPGDQVADLSAITKDCIEDLVGEDILSEDQMSVDTEHFLGTVQPPLLNKSSADESHSEVANAFSQLDEQRLSLDAVSPLGSKLRRSDSTRPRQNKQQKRSELNRSAAETVHERPKVLKHFCQKEKTNALAQRRYVAPPNQAGLKLRSVVGYNGNGRSNMIWHSDTGLFAYSSGCVVILEDLNAGTQRHLTGHNEEISTMALQHDFQVLASASGSHGLSVSQICIWDLEQLRLKHTLTHHQYDVVCMSYSRDDRFLISVGDYRECSIVVWTTQTYTVLTTAKTLQPVHDLRWDPYTVNEFASVGAAGSLSFWLLDETRREVGLSVHEAQLPDNLLAMHHVGSCRDSSGLTHLTCLEYAGDSVLYVGTSHGQVSAWDTRHNTCFLHWQASQDNSYEIDLLVSRRGRLLTGGGGHSVRLWSVVSVNELKLTAQNSRIGSNSAATGVVLEDEMNLDASSVSSAFDDSLDMGIVGTTSGTLWYINWIERASIRLVSGHSSKINALLVHDDKYIITGSSDGGVRLWTVNEREQTLQFFVQNQSCQCLALSPSLAPVASKTVDNKPPLLMPWLAAGYADGTVRLFDCNHIEMVFKMHPHAVAVSAICFSADGRMILSGGQDGLIAISSRTTGMTVRVITDQQGAPITCIDVQSVQNSETEMPGSQLWLAASNDRRVSVWSADWSRDSCELIDWMTFPAPAFTPDGTVVRTMDDEYYKAVPPCLARFSQDEIDTIMYSGYGVQKHIHFYSLAQGKVVRSLSLTDWATTLDLYNKASQLIAIGNKERLLKLMDYYEGSFQDYVGHSDSVNVVRFSSSGKLLFSVSDCELFIWTVCV